MKTVIITGANGNLGRAVTSLFLEKNYRVIATVSREENRDNFELHEMLDVQVIDLLQEDQVAVFAENMIRKYGQVHAALMLTGGFTSGDLAATGGAKINEQIALNFNTAYFLARPLFAHMLGEGYGRLVFIGARPAIKAAYGKNLVAYGLSKSLLLKLAEYLNEAARGKDLTATVLAPSTIDTPANRQQMPDADFSKWVKAEDLALVMDFLLSDPASILRETVLKTYNGA